MDENKEEIRINPEVQTTDLLEVNLETLAQDIRNPIPLEFLIKAGNLLTEAQKQSSIDGLTGVKNRRWFDETIERVISEANARGLTFYLIFLDFDNFNEINETYGHRGADEALKLISKFPHREEEPIARYGGDEFVQIVSPKNEKEVMDLARRFHNKMEEETRGHFGTEGKPPVTISIGVARFQGENAKDLVSKADGAAYKAKGAGKRTTVLARTLSSGQVRYFEQKPGDQK